MADNGNAKPGGGGSGAYTINLDNFSKRLKVFYDHWKEHNSDLWGSSNAIAIATPPPSEDLRYLKSSALDVWLLGYEFPETIIVFMHKQIHFLCSQKKANLIGTLKKAANDAVGADIVLHVKAKNDSGVGLMEDIVRAVCAQSKSDDPIVGHIAKEAPEGKLLEAWADKLSSSSVQLTDITNGFSELFAMKDTSEIACVKKASYLTSSVMKNFVVPKLEKVIDEERKVTHSSLMDETEKAILDPLKVKVKLKAENVDICYPPVFQSGGKFDLKPGASSNDDYLYYDSASVIICAIGARYGNYCSNMARTFLIDATPTQSKAYETLMKAHEAALEALKPGNRMSAVYQAAVDVIEKNAPELLPNLTKSAGTGIGLEFRESGLNLNPKNDRIIKAGMVFNVSLGLHNLQAETKSEKTKQYSLLLADTCLVPLENLTASCSKLLKDVAYSFNDEDEVLPVKKVEVNAKEALPPTKATLRSDNQEMSKEELRRQHQAELARQKNEETARRLAGVGSGSGDGRGPSRSSNELVAYKNVNDVPYARELVIQVDQKNEAVLLPIYGSMVPFHVSTVKSVTSHQDNRTCTIRIFFNVPGMPFSNDSNLKSQGEIYLKEITFRSKDPRHSSEVVQQIKTLRRQVASRESERAERATLVTQEKLQLASNRNKPVRLSDVWIRPAFGGRGRKLTGTLESHVNGFRYSTSRADERVDIMYGNVKHAFFQPAEKEMITLLHFHLHNHIMVGNKKTKDVQFYVEVMDVVQTLGGNRRSALDPDEIEEEQRERDRKNRINMDFQNFVNKVNDHWSQPQFKGLDLEFDVPLRELGFHGVPYKASAFIIPTTNRDTLPPPPLRGSSVEHLSAHELKLVTTGGAPFRCDGCMQPGDGGAGYRCGGATSATSTCARAARSRRPPWSTTCSRSARSRSSPSRRRRPPPRAAGSATPAATACAASSTTPTTPTSTSTHAARSCAGASWCRTAATSSSASARRRAGLCGERSGRRHNFWAYRTYDDDGEPVYLHIACVKDGYRGRCAAAVWR
uniref:FACT complex subunit n=1 Tax=Oryza nivara TaxID=4536 RepID=A0A0E0GK56_ORYNI